jgi:hypothetical protein
MVNCPMPDCWGAEDFQTSTTGDNEGQVVYWDRGCLARHSRMPRCLNRPSLLWLEMNLLLEAAETPAVPVGDAHVPS